MSKPASNPYKLGTKRFSQGDGTIRNRVVLLTTVNLVVSKYKILRKYLVLQYSLNGKDMRIFICEMAKKLKTCKNEIKSTFA